jgi:hypothetical protein
VLNSRIIQQVTSHGKRLSARATAVNADLTQRMIETFGGMQLICAFGVKVTNRRGSCVRYE